MEASHYAYNVLKMSAEWEVLKVKSDQADAILCIDNLNKTLIAPSCEREGELMYDPEVYPRNSDFPRVSSSASFSKKPFHEDSQLTKKVASYSDGTHPVTIGTPLPDE